MTGMQPPGADVLGAFIDLEGHFGEPPHAGAVELEIHAFGGEQCRVLAAQRRVRLGQNAHEILDRQGIELHADGQAALQFGNQIGGFRHVKCPRRDEQHMIGLHRAVTWY